MRQIVILSGRGGAGKTMLAAGLAHLAAQEGQLVLADADIEAAHLELLLAPTRISEQAYRGGALAVIDEDGCIACGVCDEICRYDAVMPNSDGYIVIEHACEGCGACIYQCPVEAISMQERLQGVWLHSQTRYGDLFHAHLYAGQDNSSRLVTLVKQKAGRWGVDHDADWLLVDGPRGIALPMLAAAAGADLLVMVVGPGNAVLEDLERMLSSVRRAGVTVGVVLNRWGEERAAAEDIVRYCAENELVLLGRIPEDEVVTRSLVARQPVTSLEPGPVADAIRAIWRRMRKQLLHE